MSLKSCKDGAFSLANILFSTCLAGNAVNQIGASACDVNLALIFETSDMAFYLAICVEQGAIIAFFPCYASVSDHIRCGQDGLGCRSPGVY